MLYFHILKTGLNEVSQLFLQIQVVNNPNFL